MKRLLFLLLSAFVLCSFILERNPLKGTWEYRGGLFNGKPDTVSHAYTLQRTYDKLHYKAILKEKGEKDLLYEKGDYQLVADTCFETQTYSLQQSKLLNKKLGYTYIISNDTLKLLTILPNGNRVEDHWVKIR